MQKAVSIALIALACVTLLMQIYGRRKLDCSKMRTSVVSTFGILIVLYFVAIIIPAMQS